jgi:hypothetical protein
MFSISSHEPVQTKLTTTQNNQQGMATKGLNKHLQIIKSKAAQEPT